MADRVGQQLGHYRLLRLLGQGSFAEVYLGEHLYLERPAAIKVLHTRLISDDVDKFRAEARTIAHLQHPHIVQVLDFGLDDQTPYLVMEYTPGGTLRQRHPKATRLAFEQIVSYVKQIASALDYAHQHHVIHRDIKPDNLLLNARDELVLSDFGIAVVQHTLDSLSTQNPAGTPIYMAPEQIQRKPCAASDQYALGVMVYEWLCGEPPFRGSLYEVFSQHLHEPPPSLCAQVPQLPPAVEAAVFGALAKDPRQRFVSVQDFATVLEGVFSATQSLSLRGTGEQGLPDRILPPVAAIAAKPTLVPSGQSRSAAVTPSPPSQNHTHVQQVGSPAAQTNRQRLLRRVRSFWITGVLEQSLHGAALMALGLHEQPDAVAAPWHLVFQPPDTAPRPLPTGTRIIQVYDAADGELLILGAPGSGKTTLLLELARDLLERAEHDERHPMPVIFNLSSWAMKQQRLTDWFVEELTSKYQVPRKLGQALVDADQILPLLDGLDEVDTKKRTACIETINTYRQEHGLLPLVVCTRSADYFAQSKRVLLRSAVAVQPLTEQQVDDYLASGGEPLWGLRVALHRDAALRELTSAPLMLSVLTLAYRGKSVADLLTASSPETQRRQLFTTYVQRMLVHRGSETRYTPQQTVRWLTWLARQMKRHSQTEFYIERIQPDWLMKGHLHLLYSRILRLVGVLIGIFASVLLILFLLFVGIQNDLQSLFILIPVLGPLLGGLLFSSQDGKIQLLENIHWSSVLRLGYIAIPLLVVLLGGWVLFGGSKTLLTTGVPIGACVLIILLISRLEDGSLAQALSQQERVVPNQGIWFSVRNSLLFGALFGALFGVPAGVVFGSPTEIASHFLCALTIVFLGEIIIGLPFGGFACIQHMILRLLLWRAGFAPLYYPRFLDYAADHILLRKVGGGYIFVHRLLLEYFASLDTIPDEKTRQAQEVHRAHRG